MQSVIQLGEQNTQLRSRLLDIAKYQASKEAELQEAKLNTAKHKLLIVAAHSEVDKYAKRASTASDEVHHAEKNLNTAQDMTQDALAKATSLVNQHRELQEGITQARASYVYYKTDSIASTNSQITTMAKLATRTSDLSERLVQLLETLREEQIQSTEARMGVIRKLTQSMVNAFACTGCHSMDTATVYERPPMDTFVDENQGEAWTEKQSLKLLYQEFTKKATQFNSLPAPEDLKWKSYAEAASNLAKVMNLDIMHPTPEIDAGAAPIKKGATTTTTPQSTTTPATTTTTTKDLDIANENPVIT